MKKRILFILALLLLLPGNETQSRRLHSCSELARLYRGKALPVPLQTEKKDTISTRLEKKRFSESDIEIFGFDKRLQTKSETFLLRNNTDHRISLITLRFIYKTLKGEMIDHRDVTITCDILPQATKSITIDSFDRAYAYRYEKSDIVGRKTGIAFQVAYDIVRYDIRIDLK